MKAFIVLALVCAVARGGVVHAPYGVYGIPETGASQVSRVEDGLGSYSFGYDEAHTTGGSFHKESGTPGVKVGSYGLTGADGRVRVVNYVADGLGFRADVKTNEPGVGAQDPAATLINKAGVVAAAPAIAAYAAPAVAAIGGPVIGGAYSTHVAHGGVVAPAVAAYAAPAIATGVVSGPVVGASYASSVAHGGVVAPALGYAGAIHGGLGYAGVHGLGYGINRLGYSGIHGLGYSGINGLGYSGIHGLGYSGIHGLGYSGVHAGVPGYVTKIGHGAGLLGGVKVL